MIFGNSPRNVCMIIVFVHCSCINCMIACFRVLHSPIKLLIIYDSNAIKNLKLIIQYIQNRVIRVKRSNKNNLIHQVHILSRRSLAHIVCDIIIVQFIMNESSYLLTEQYKGLISRFEELLRCYRIAKRNDKSEALQARVKAKCRDLLNKMRSFPFFQDIQQDCRQRLDAVLREKRSDYIGSSKNSQISQRSSKNSDVPAAKKNPPPVQSIQSSSSNNFSQKSSFSQLNSSNSMPPKLQISSIKKIEEQRSIETIQKVMPSGTSKPTPSGSSKQGGSLKMDVLNESKSSSGGEYHNKVKSIGSLQMSKLNQNDDDSENSQSQGSLLGILESTPRQQISKPEGERLDRLENREDDTQHFSQASQAEKAMDMILKFYDDNKQKINSQLLFNEDIFDQIRQQQGDLIFLFGVNKPEGKKISKLYVCTLMKFSISEVLKSEIPFEKQIRDFKNNIRTPIGLIIKGDSPKAIQPEHIKFLLNLQCPFLTILVLNSFEEYNGHICYFHDHIIEKIKITPRKQLGQCAQQLLKKTVSLPFNSSFLPKQKTRYVITKQLVRTIVTAAEQAPNAISISDNQCIRQEKNSFNYKLHTKFLVTNKPEFAIYYADNGIVNARQGFKDFDQFKKQSLALQPKLPAIFSVNVPRQNSTIRKQFFQVLLLTNKVRDPCVFIHLNNLSMKKTIVVTLRSNMNLKSLEGVQLIPFKNFQKDTPATLCILIISKQNSKEFQVQGKIDLIDMKPK